MTFQLDKRSYRIMTMTETEIKSHTEKMTDLRAEWWRVWIGIKHTIPLTGGPLTRDRQLIAAQRGAWEMFKSLKSRST